MVKLVQIPRAGRCPTDTKRPGSLFFSRLDLELPKTTFVPRPLERGRARCLTQFCFRLVQLSGASKIESSLRVRRRLTTRAGIGYLRGSRTPNSRPQEQRAARHKKLTEE